MLKGLGRVQKKIGNMTAIDRMRRPMLQSLALLEHDMVEYPPEIPNSTYIRTGIYGQGWNIPPLQRSKTRLRGRVATAVDYAPWVGNQTFQAGIHRGRWVTDRQAVNRNADDIVKLFQKEIDRILRK